MGLSQFVKVAGCTAHHLKEICNKVCVKIIIIKVLFNFFQSGWSIPVEIVIGPDLGISYMTPRAPKVRSGM